MDQYDEAALNTGKQERVVNGDTNVHGRAMSNGCRTRSSQRGVPSENRSSSSVPRVKYLPQRYFEELCHDQVKGDDSLLQGELPTVIFSHIPVDERDGADSLDELIGLSQKLSNKKPRGCRQV